MLREVKAGYLGYSGLSKRGISWMGKPGFLCICVTSSCTIQLVICLFI